MSQTEVTFAQQDISVQVLTPTIAQREHQLPTHACQEPTDQLLVAPLKLSLALPVQLNTTVKTMPLLAIKSALRAGIAKAVRQLTCQKENSAQSDIIAHKERKSSVLMVIIRIRLAKLRAQLVLQDINVPILTLLTALLLIRRNIAAKITTVCKEKMKERHVQLVITPQSRPLQM